MARELIKSDLSIKACLPQEKPYRLNLERSVGRGIIVQDIGFTVI